MFKYLKEKIIKILRWTEKWTKTDMVYLTKGGFWLSSIKIISTLSSFILAIFFANLIPKETYGDYKYILSFAGVLTIFSLADMGSAVIRSVARGFEKTLYLALKTQIKWGTIGSLTSLIISAYYYFQNNNKLAGSFLIITLFIPIIDSFNIYSTFLNGKQRFNKLANYGIINKIVSVSSLILTITLTKNLFIILIVYFLTTTLLRLISLINVIITEKPNEKIEPGAVTYGKQLSLIKGINTMAGSIGNILIFNILGSQSLAIFSLAIAPIEQIRSFIGIGGVLMLPKFSKDKWEIPEIKIFFKKLIPASLISLLIIVLYIIFAPLIYKMFFPKYLESVIYSQIFSLSIIFTVINNIETNILRAKKEIKKIHIMNFFDVGLNIFLTIPMIYFYGIMGMVISTILIKIAEFFLMTLLIFNKKLFKQKQ